MKVPSAPDGGKRIAKCKGVHREQEEYPKASGAEGVTPSVQQAIATRPSPIFEPKPSESSFGSRPDKSAHDALCACKRHTDEGCGRVADTDFEKLFDTACRSKPVQVVSGTVKDGRVAGTQ